MKRAGGIVLFLICGAAALCDAIDRFLYGAAPASLRDWAALAAQVKARDLAVLCSNARDLTSVDRARLIAVNWSRGLSPARAIEGLSPLKGRPGAILASAWLSPRVWKGLRRGGYRPVASNETVVLWQPLPYRPRFCGQARGKSQ